MRALFAVSAIILLAGFAAVAQLTPAELERRRQEKLHSRGGPSAGHSRGGQPEQECNSAIAVCQSSFSQPSAYSGFGATQEVPISSCLGEREKNSVWYIFTVQSAGTLQFTIDPNDPNDDYDFALYDLTNRNCSDIAGGAAPEVRCNFCVDPGPTGISAAGTNPSEDCCTNSPGCQFSSILNVTAGQTYVLVVSNYSSSQSGYDLTFGGTAVIFDNTPPAPVSVTTPCNATYLTVQMSEAVLCSSITPDGSEFSVTGPGGPFTVTGATGINCGSATSQITVNFSPPAIQGSNYTLTINTGSDGNTLIDNCGNPAAPGTSLNFTAVPPAASISGPAEVCRGSAILLAASQGTSYLWNTGDATQSITVRPTANTTYSVTITSGTCVQNASHLVTVKDAPTANFTVSPNPACSGQPVTFTNTSTLLETCIFLICIPNPSFYTWDFDDGSGFDASQSPSHTFSNAGVYNVSLTVTDLIAGCSNEITIPVTVQPGGGSLTVSNDVTICAGESTVLTVSGGSSYNWTSNPAGFTSTASTITVSPTVTTTYTVTSPGCSATLSASVTVTVGNTASISVSPANPVICPGGSVTLTASGALTYTWTPANGLNTTSGAAVDATPSVTTSYNITGTTAAGCAAAGSVTVSVNPALNPIISGPTTFCTGGSTTLDAGVYTAYAWSTGESTQTIVVTQSGAYAVTVSDNNGCTGTATVSVTESATLNPVISPAGPVSLCTGNVMLDAGAGYASYLWNTGESTRTISVSLPGSYDVTVSDGAGCSGISQPVIVTSGASLAPVITPSGPITLCNGASATLDAGAGYAVYAWSNGAATRTITVTQAGNYSVTVSDNFGCTGASPQVVVAVNTINPPVITPDGPTAFCLGGSVNLHATAGYADYAWNTGEFDSVIYVAQSGSYTVTVTDNNQCTASSAAVTVTVYPPLRPAITPSGPVSFCAGGYVDLTADAGFIDYAWSNGHDQPTIRINQSGSFSVSVTDAAGCTGSSPALQVTVFETPVITVSDTCRTAKGAITVTVGGGAAPYIYSWSDGSEGMMLSDLNDGLYSVTVTDNNQCTASASSVIACFVEDLSFITVPSAFSPNSDGKNDFLNVLGDRTKVASYEFGIFNRWGQKVYSTNDVSVITSTTGSAKGWDGFFQGNPQDVGVYTYHLDVIFVSGRKENLKGTITLVK